jgi:hypothetical protein
MSLMSPIYTAVNSLLSRLSEGRAAALDKLDANISTRAPASTAVSTANATNSRLANLDNLDAAMTSRAAASDYTPARAAKLDQLDAAISSRMAGIKGIQRGTVTIASNQTSGTATITSVDTAKTELRHLGATGVVTGESGFRNRIALTNATTITATRASSNADTVTVGWELTEYT